MSDKHEVGFKEAYRKSTSRNFSLLALLIFFAGLALRLGTANQQGFMWEAAREVGSFVSVAVGVAFLYEHFIRAEERRIYLSDLDELFRRYFRVNEQGLTIFEHGRPTMAEKLAVIKSAKKEVVEVGVAMRTFVSYFHTRPAAEFKDYVFGLCRQGVTFRCLLLDPDWSLTHATRDSTLVQRIRASIDSLRSLALELRANSATASFQVLLYRHTPYFAAICVDGDSADGEIIWAPYLYGANNAESPAFLIRKRYQPVLFEKYWRAVRFLISQAQELPLPEKASAELDGPKSS